MMPRNACTRPNRRGVRKTLVAGLVLTTPPVVGTTLIVLDGPGLGQTRLITAVGPGNNTVVLESALDDWVVAASTISRESGGGTGKPSLVAVLSSFGSKIFAGNTFNWTEVVQWCALPCAMHCLHTCQFVSRSAPFAGMETQCAGLWQITASMTATSSQVCVAK